MPSQEQFSCHQCECSFNAGDLHFWNGNYWCDNCLEQETRLCDSCGNRFYSGDVNYDGNDCYCEECYDYQNSENETVPTIKIPFSKIKAQTYRLNPYKNFCGVEIECLNDNLSSEWFSYDDLIKYQFSQVYDGSLIANCGAEFPSNAFSGDTLLLRIRRFCNEINKRNYYVNKSCGLHIHIATSKRTEHVKKIFAFYSRFENFFFKMLPSSRYKNQYCLRFLTAYNNITLDDIRNCKNSLEFQKLLYDSKSFSDINKRKKNKYDGKRYAWINFHSLFYRGTLEIRSHSGTINYHKIKNWLLIHLRVLNYIKNLTLNDIGNLPLSKEFFLSIFEPKLQKYIKYRWDKFSDYVTEEEN